MPEEETKTQGREMTVLKSHSLAVLGLGLSLPWDARIKPLSVLDFSLTTGPQRKQWG